MGEWTGLAFRDLEGRPGWRAFNTLRSITRIPGGELMLETQARIVSELDRLRQRHPNQNVAIVSHMDVIRAAVAHLAGVHLDLLQRIEIGPASVSAVALNELTPRILCLNETGNLAEAEFWIRGAA